MSVMKVISDVKDFEPKTESIIKRIKEMVNVLKLHGYLVPDKNQEEQVYKIIKCPLKSVLKEYTKLQPIIDEVGLL